MARIAGVDLPRTKRVEIGLTYIYGIGRKRSNDILTSAGVSPDIRVKDLSEDDVRKISRVLEEQGGVEGVVMEALPSALYRVEVDGRYWITAHIGGALDRNFVRVLVGERVLIELTRNDPTRGRIVKTVGGRQ